MLRLDFFPNLSGGTSAIVWDDPGLDLAGGGMAAVAISVGFAAVFGAAPALAVPGAALLLALSIWLLFGRDRNLTFLCVLALPLIVFAWTTACWGVCGHWVGTPNAAFGLIGYIFMGMIGLLILFAIGMATDNFGTYILFLIVMPLMWFSSFGASGGSSEASVQPLVFVVMRCVEIFTVIALVVGIVRLVKWASAGKYKFDVKAAASVGTGLIIGLILIGVLAPFSGIGNGFLRGVLLLVVFIILGAALEIASRLAKLDIDGIAILIPLLIGGSLYFLANGVNYVPLEAYDAVKSLIAGTGPLALFVDTAMQVVYPLCAFIAQVFYWVAQFVVQLVQMLFGIGDGTLPYTLEELSVGFDTLDFATIFSLMGMIIGLVLSYLCIWLGSLAVRKFNPAETVGEQRESVS